MMQDKTPTHMCVWIDDWRHHFWLKQPGQIRENQAFSPSHSEIFAPEITGFDYDACRWNRAFGTVQEERWGRMTLIFDLLGLFLAAENILLRTP
jgi:hypothetical protein